MITTLTGKNQVTIPAAVVAKLGLEPGAKLEWSLTRRPRQVLVSVQPSRSDLLKQIRQLARKHHRKIPADALAAMERQEDAEEGARWAELR